MRRIFFSILCLVFFPVPAQGKKLACLGFDGSFWQVFTIKVEGGSPTALTNTASDKTNISLDRKHKKLLIATSEGRVFIQDIGTRRVTELDLGLKGMTDAAISPKGDQAAFSLSTANSVDLNDIWLFQVKSRQLRKLTNDQGLQHHPAWSPDGSKLMFMSGKGPPSHDIFVIDMNSKSTAQLTAGTYYNFGANLSAHDRVVFSSNRKGNYDIYTMSITGGNVQRLTSEPSFDGEPSWSIDGSKIVYVSTESGKRQLCIMTQDGSGKKTVHTDFPVRKPIWLE